MFIAPTLTTLLLAAGGFTLTMMVYFAVSAIYRSTFLPHWLSGDVVCQMICVGLTGALVGTMIATFTAASFLPFGALGDASSAMVILIGAALASYGIYRGIGHLVHARPHA